MAILPRSELCQRGYAWRADSNLANVVRRVFGLEQQPVETDQAKDLGSDRVRKRGPATDQAFAS
jgi:hypothetical protein